MVGETGGLLGQVDAASPTDAPSVPGRFVSATVALAMASGLVYLIAYFYELGYISRFHLPLWVVEVSATRALMGGASILFAILVVRLLLDVLPADLSGLRVVAVYVIMPAGLTAIGIGAVLYAFDQPKTLPLRLAAGLDLLMSLVAIGGLTIHPLVVHRHHSQGLIDRYRHAFDVVSRRRTLSALDRVNRQFTAVGADTPAFWLASLLGLFAICCALVLGYGQAATELDYLVSDTPVRLAALRQYGDRLLCIEIDSLGHPRAHFRFLQASEPSRSWALVHTGGLSAPAPLASDSIR